MIGVRFRPEGAEGQCDYCREWWPIAVEFWYPTRGLRKCLACIREGDRARARQRRIVPLDYRTLIGIARRRAYNREWMRRRRAAA